MDGELCTELWDVRGRASCRAWGVEGDVGLEERVQAFLWVGQAWVTGRTALRGEVPAPRGFSAEPRERRGQLGQGPKAGPERQLWKAKAQDSAMRSWSDAGCPGGQQTGAGGSPSKTVSLARLHGQVIPSSHADSSAGWAFPLVVYLRREIGADFWVEVWGCRHTVGR